MRFPREWVDELLNKVDIVTVVQESRIGLKRRFKGNSNEFICLCPFHSERTPSSTVTQCKKFYHCFGCGAHGNAISFLMEYRGFNFSEAAVFLAKRFKVKISNKEVEISIVLKSLSNRETLDKDVVRDAYMNYLNILDSIG